jgi:hypothetical protein
MNAINEYLKTLGRAAVRKWDEFFFSPVDPTLTALLRICTGLMLVYTHFVWGLALDDFFGRYSWLDPGMIRYLQTDRDSAEWSLWWLVSTDWMGTFHWACLAVLAMFTLGLFTRVTSVLSLVIAISYGYRTPTALFGLDQINALLTMYLCLGPCGAALSLDRLIRRWRKGELSPPRPSVASNVSLRLIQLHMCVIYFFAGVAKLRGYAWSDGTAMWLSLANLEYTSQSFDMTWMARHPRLIDVMTHVTVLWELSFCLLIWRPLLRPVVLAVGVVLHLGIGAFLGMWTFGLIMLVGCASFLPPEMIRQWVWALVPYRGRESDPVVCPPRRAEWSQG